MRVCSLARTRLLEHLSESREGIHAPGPVAVAATGVLQNRRRHALAAIPFSSLIKRSNARVNIHERTCR